MSGCGYRENQHNDDRQKFSRENMINPFNGFFTIRIDASDIAGSVNLFVPI